MAVSDTSELRVGGLVASPATASGKHMAVLRREDVVVLPGVRTHLHYFCVLRIRLCPLLQVMAAIKAKKGSEFKSFERKLQQQGGSLVSGSTTQLLPPF